MSSQIINLEDFEFIKKHENLDIKSFYRNKNSGKTWIISNHFSHESYISYLVSDLYKLILGDNAPNIQLIRKPNGDFSIGSEFIDNYVELLDLFDTQSFKLCVPRNCIIKDKCIITNNTGQSTIINNKELINFEKVIASLLLLGESDGQGHNIGAVLKNDQYVAAKIDHDRSLADIHLGNDFNDLVKAVSIRKVLSYNDFNVPKLIEAFEEIKLISDDDWKNSIIDRYNILVQNNLFERASYPFYKIISYFYDICNIHHYSDLKISIDFIGNIISINKSTIEILMERKNLIDFYIKSLECQYLIKNDSELFKILLSDSYFNIDTKYNIYDINSVYNSLTILEMAIYFNKNELVKWILDDAKNISITKKAIEFAIIIGDKEFWKELYLKYPQVNDDKDIIKLILIFDNNIIIDDILIERLDLFSQVELYKIIESKPANHSITSQILEKIGIEYALDQALMTKQYEVFNIILDENIDIITNGMAHSLIYDNPNIYNNNHPQNKYFTEVLNKLIQENFFDDNDLLYIFKSVLEAHPHTPHLTKILIFESTNNKPLLTKMFGLLIKNFQYSFICDGFFTELPEILSNNKINPEDLIEFIGEFYNSGRSSSESFQIFENFFKSMKSLNSDYLSKLLKNSLENNNFNFSKLLFKLGFSLENMKYYNIETEKCLDLIVESYSNHDINLPSLIYNLKDNVSEFSFNKVDCIINFPNFTIESKDLLTSYKIDGYFNDNNIDYITTIEKLGISDIYREFFAVG